MTVGSFSSGLQSLHQISYFRECLQFWCA